MVKNLITNQAEKTLLSTATGRILPILVALAFLSMSFSNPLTHPVTDTPTRHHQRGETDKKARQTAENLLAQLSRNILTPNRAALSQLIAPSFKGIGFAGQVVDKAAYIKVHTNPDDPFKTMDLTIEGINASQNLILVHGRQHVVAGFNLTSQFVVGIARVKAAWQFVYYQETAIVDPKIFN